jgi:hypothetical protein
MFELGGHAKDVITGFAGVVTGKCTYLTGCDQYQVQPRMFRDGKKSDPEWFDETRLELIEGEPRIVLGDAATPPGPDKPAPMK